jgi:hypothetical protein
MASLVSASSYGSGNPATPAMASSFTSQDQPGRTANFQQGITGGGPVASSLDMESSRQNAQVGGFTTTSVLDAYQMPGFHPNDGNSSIDVQRQTPGGQLPTQNGMATQTYNALNPSYKTRLAA